MLDGAFHIRPVDQAARNSRCFPDPHRHSSSGPESFELESESRSSQCLVNRHLLQSHSATLPSSIPPKVTHC